MDEVTEFTVVQHEGTDSEESLSEGETRKRKAEDQKRETEEDRRNAKDASYDAAGVTPKSTGRKRRSNRETSETRKRSKEVVRDQVPNPQGEANALDVIFLCTIAGSSARGTNGQDVKVQHPMSDTNCSS